MDYSKKMVWGFLLFVSFAFTGCTEKSMKDSFVETVNGVSFEMIHVDGQDQLEGFFIGQTEVTQELWEAVMSIAVDTTFMDPEKYIYPSYFSWKNGFVDIPQRPVENITLLKVQLFIIWLNRLTGREFRLPTDAEWEFAARGGNLSKGYKYAGSNNIDEVAWYRDNAWTVGADSPDYGTHAVGTKAPNELGLYDMSGNVFERTADRSGYTYPSEPEVDPSYPRTNANHHFSEKGGSYNNQPKHCRVSSRMGDDGIEFENVGFRLAL